MSKKWRQVQKHRIGPNRVLNHMEWPHEANGGNHEGEQIVNVVYTHPEEDWSTSLDNTHFWGEDAKARAQKEFDKRKEALTADE